MSNFTSQCLVKAKDKFEHSSDRISVPIATVKDIVTARQYGRELTSEYGFSCTDSTLIATIIAELGRNILLYARKGKIILEGISEKNGRGIAIISQDDGPGIADVDRALMGGYSTSGGLGLGLCGVRKMADTFHIDTSSKGTTIVVGKKTFPTHSAPIGHQPAMDRKVRKCHLAQTAEA